MDDLPAFDGVLHLVSHLFHELVSPIGAINNGLELLDEAAEGRDSEAMALIVQSARTLTARLRCYRLAYGMAGRSPSHQVSDARIAVQNWFAAESRFTLDWPLDPKRPLQIGFVQLLLNGVICITQLSQRGGRISVAFDERAPQETRVTVVGTTTAIPAWAQAALTGRSAVVDHRNAHFRFFRHALNSQAVHETPNVELIALEQGAGLSFALQVSLDDG